MEAIADELAIRNLVARYADAVSRRDHERWASTWATKGEWSLLGQVAQGREDVVALFRRLVDGFAFVAQHLGSGEIDLADGAATGRWQIVEYAKLANGTALLTLGLYDDEYVREDGEWRFRSRRFRPLYSGPPDLSAQPIPLAD
jgi:hypothetical protein